MRKLTKAPNFAALELESGVSRKTIYWRWTKGGDRTIERLTRKPMPKPRKSYAGRTLNRWHFLAEINGSNISREAVWNWFYNKTKTITEQDAANAFCKRHNIQL